MIYWYQGFGDGSFSIWHCKTRSALGHLEPYGKGYHVKDGDHAFVAVIECREQAVRALSDHYKQHSKWRYEGENEYLRWTEFGLLQVIREETGGWSVCRNAEQQLMRDNEVATFPTPQEAQSAADAHCGDDEGCSGSDGLSWLMFELAGSQWWDAVEVSLPLTR